MRIKIHNWLEKQGHFIFSLYAIVAAFTTYFSMYAFRKPFTAAIFADMELWGVDYKIIAITAQVLGYTLSKFVGIKLVSELKPNDRIKRILILMGIAWISLLFFAITPAPYNIVFLFFNGLPLGMMWGVVFSFLEGRRFTELMGAGMASSFIVSSGMVKATGRALVYNHGVSEFLMPFLTGLIYVPALIIGTYLLSAIPKPSAEDEKFRTKRVPMTPQDRKAFFVRFMFGIIFTVAIYIALTIFRDIRDNFAVEIWKSLGFADQPAILAMAEIPIAIVVLIIVAFMVFIKNNKIAFYLNLAVMIVAGLLMLVTTYVFKHYAINPVLWMMMNGFSMYLAYICFNTFFFERWIAFFNYKSNIGFLMYIADAFGYLGSVAILFMRNFMNLGSDWLAVFINISYVTGIVSLVLGVIAVLYFLQKEKRCEAVDAQPVFES